jgi:hypothetical protein
MAGNGAMNTQVDAARESPVPQESFGELRGTLAIGSLGRDPAG